MIDLSDGLSTDLARLCAASRAGARIWADRIPAVVIPSRVAKLRGMRDISPLELALHGGEDYELLFTLPSSSSPPQGTTLIGNVHDGRAGAVIFQGKPLPARGYDHFAGG